MPPLIEIRWVVLELESARQTYRSNIPSTAIQYWYFQLSVRLFGTNYSLSAQSRLRQIKTQWETVPLSTRHSKGGLTTNKLEYDLRIQTSLRYTIVLETVFGVFFNEIQMKFVIEAYVHYSVSAVISFVKIQLQLSSVQRLLLISSVAICLCLKRKAYSRTRLSFLFLFGSYCCLYNVTLFLVLLAALFKLGASLKCALLLTLPIKYLNPSELKLKQIR